METFLQLLEILAFFSGYAMIYLLMNYLKHFKIMQRFTKLALSVLPFAYGVIGLLFLGLQLKTLSIHSDLARFHHPYLLIWGILSIVFIFPTFSKLPSFSLLHSLVFLFVLARKIFFQDIKSEGKYEVMSNYMNIYSISLALNLLVLLLVMAVSTLLQKIKFRNT